MSRLLNRALTSVPGRVLAAAVLAAASFAAGWTLLPWLTLLLVVMVPLLLGPGRWWFGSVAWLGWALGAYVWVFDLSLLVGPLLLVVLASPSLVALLLSRFRLLVLWSNFFVYTALAAVGVSWVSPGVAVAPALPAVTARFGVVGVEVLLAAFALLVWLVSTRPMAGAGAPLLEGRSGGSVPFSRWRRGAMVGVPAMCASLFLLPAPSGPGFVAEGDGLRVGFVQTDRPGVESLLFGNEDLGSALGMLLQAEGAFDVVVLPEAVTSSELLPGSAERASVEGVSKRLGDAVVAVGVADKIAERNSVRFLSSSGDLGRYDKVNLVPGSERKFSWLPGFDDWMAFEDGAGPVVVSGDGFRAGALICYDVGDASMVLGYARAGVDLLLLSSSTGRLPDQVGRQQLLVSRVRALESGVPLVLSSRGGPSALIASDGSLTEMLDRRAVGVGAAVLSGPSRRPSDPTLPLLAMVFLGGLVVFGSVRAARR